MYTINLSQAEIILAFFCVLCFVILVAVVVLLPKRRAVEDNVEAEYITWASRPSTCPPVAFVREPEDTSDEAVLSRLINGYNKCFVNFSSSGNTSWFTGFDGYRTWPINRGSESFEDVNASSKYLTVRSGRPNALLLFHNETMRVMAVVIPDPVDLTVVYIHTGLELSKLRLDHEALRVVLIPVDFPGEVRYIGHSTYSLTTKTNNGEEETRAVDGTGLLREYLLFISPYIRQ